MSPEQTPEKYAVVISAGRLRVGDVITHHGLDPETMCLRKADSPITVTDAVSSFDRHSDMFMLVVGHTEANPVVFRTISINARVRVER